MAMSGFTKDMNIIQKLNDEPNDRDGLTAGELKAKFDEGGLAVKDYLNNTVKPYVDGLEEEKVDKVSGKGLSTNDYTTAEKNKLAGIAAGAQVNSITGVKGNAESSYRTGNVNLTPANVGAAAASHSHSADDIVRGTLPLARGGTGQITANAAANALVSSLGSATSDFTDETLMATSHANGETNTWYKRPATALWNYVRSKAASASAIQYGPSGVVNFQGSEDFPVASCVAEITPVQAGSGDPSPTNVRAISGWTGAKVHVTGKNLFDSDVFLKASGWTKSNGEYTGSNRQFYTAFNSRFNPLGIFGKGMGLGQVAISFWSKASESGGNLYFYVIYTDGTKDQIVTNTTDYAKYTLITNPSKTIALIDGSYSKDGTSWIKDFQIELGGTVTAYEPFRNVYDVTFPVAIGTVYGGTLDVLSGTLTVDKASVTISSGLAYYESAYSSYHYRFVFNQLDNLAKPNSTSELISNIGVPAVGSGFSSASVGVYVGNGSSRGSIFINKSLVSPTSAAGNAWVAEHPVQIVFPLENPVTYQLTPQQVTAVAGSNHVWADTGDVTVEYGAFPGALQRELERHTHAATDITSGVLPVARGGTGNATGYVTAGQKSGESLGSHATAEGRDTIAFGDGSHAEGYKTFASGNYSHVEGYGTYAVGVYQHVFGRYNADSTSYVEIVGGGTGEDDRKNIRTLNWSGNEWLAGTLTQASDARLKDVEGEIPDVSGIRAVRFRWNDRKSTHDELDHIGYLAQEVEEVAPFLVGQDANGYKSLDYIALLCAKVEMLEREVRALRAAAGPEGGD